MNSIERPYPTLADTVRQARTGKRMSQRRLSDLLGKSQGYLGHLESGRFRPTVGYAQGAFGGTKFTIRPIGYGSRIYIC